MRFTWTSLYDDAFEARRASSALVSFAVCSIFALWYLAMLHTRIQAAKITRTHAHEYLLTVRAVQRTVARVHRPPAQHKLGIEGIAPPRMQPLARPCSIGSPHLSNVPDDHGVHRLRPHPAALEGGRGGDRAELSSGQSSVSLQKHRMGSLADTTHMVQCVITPPCTGGLLAFVQYPPQQKMADANTHEGARVTSIVVFQPNCLLQ